MDRKELIVGLPKRTVTNECANSARLVPNNLALYERCDGLLDRVVKRLSVTRGFSKNKKSARDTWKQLQFDGDPWIASQYDAWSANLEERDSHSDWKRLWKPKINDIYIVNQWTADEAPTEEECDLCILRVCLRNQGRAPYRSF